MNTPASIVILSGKSSEVTPFELLEDFADSTETWYYLEDESLHYARFKGVPACILKWFDPAHGQEVDFGFAAEDTTCNRVRLIVIDAPGSHPLTGHGLEAGIDCFAGAFQAYLASRNLLSEFQLQGPVSVPA